jgi:hypothetical protein
LSSSLRFTLLSDGSSDRALVRVLEWLLRAHSKRFFEPQWADLRILRQGPKSLRDRVPLAVQLYPCELLFVHRDAEGVSLHARTAEIREQLDGRVQQPAICVIPVRMQEARFLFDESAIREAAGNPRGSAPLDLPRLDEIESLPDPKRIIHECLRSASGLGTRRRFNVGVAFHRMAGLIDDFAPLRRLAAFQALEAEVEGVLDERSWRD